MGSAGQKAHKRCVDIPRTPVTEGEIQSLYELVTTQECGELSVRDPVVFEVAKVGEHEIVQALPTKVAFELEPNHLWYSEQSGYQQSFFSL